VVQQRLGDGLRHAQHRHVRGHRAAQIVDDPRFGAFGQRLVEPVLQATEPRNWRFAGGREHVVRPEEPRHPAQHVNHRVGDRNRVLPAVFRALRRQGPQAFFEVEFRPAHLGDLGASLAAEDQQLHAIPERIAFGVTGRPQRAQLIVGQDTLTRPFLGQRFHSGDGGSIDHAALDTPAHQVLEVGQRAVRADRRGFVDQIAGFHDIGALDLVDPFDVQGGELRQQGFLALPVAVVNLGVLFDVIGDHVAQRGLRFDLDASAVLEPSRLDFVEHLSHPFTRLGQRHDAEPSDGQATHLTADALVQAERLGAGRADAQDQTWHQLVAEIEPFRRVGLLAFDELGGEFAFHKPMIRWADKPRQGQL